MMKILSTFYRQSTENHLTKSGVSLIIKMISRFRLLRGPVEGGNTMGGQDKNCIGVIAAEVNSIEQRQIMRGVIDRAREIGRRTVVFSNLYNPYEYDTTLELENDIYRLIFSRSLCGLIMISESFTNPQLQEKLRSLLVQRQDIPIVIIGIRIPELSFPNVRFINANDALDME